MNIKNNVPLISQGIAIAASLVGILAVVVWANPCDGALELANGNMVPMRCAYTAKIAILLFALVIVTSGKNLVTRKPESLTLALLGIALIVITFESVVGIGVCKSEMMCWSMATWIRGCGIAIILCGAADATRALSEKQVR